MSVEKSGVVARSLRDLGQTIFVGGPVLVAALLLAPFLALTLIAWILLRLASKPAPAAFATESRIQLWSSLSDLFLDTEHSSASLNLIAEQIRESGLTEREAWRVLETEVAPACAFNLYDVAGEWEAGVLSGPWLTERILERQPAAARMRKIPILGHLFAGIVTLGMRGQFRALMAEAFPNDQRAAE